MLKNILKPKKNYLLNRLGKNNDGGYLVGPKSIENTETLISFGISDDWTFEKEFIKDKNILLKCYDDHISKKFLIKRIIYKIIFFPFIKNKFSIFTEIKKLFDFVNFFKKHQLSIEKISYGSLDKIFSNLQNKNIFLKIDIEGYEYRILDEIMSNQKRIIGMVIEFHIIDLHMDRICNFINNFNLELIHIHGNNFSDNFNNNPTTLELTFDKDPYYTEGKNSLPNKLDMPCDQHKDEVQLHFENTNN